MNRYLKMTAFIWIL